MTSEIMVIESELEEAVNLIAFLNHAAVEMVLNKNHSFEKEGMGLQHCFFHLEKKLERAHDALYQLRTKFSKDNGGGR